MAKFRGFTVGNTGPATRNGSSKSGVVSTAQSWEGSVSIELYELDGEIHCRIRTGEGSQAFPMANLLYDGKLEYLINGNAGIDIRRFENE